MNIKSRIYCKDNIVFSGMNYLQIDIEAGNIYILESKRC